MEACFATAVENKVKKEQLTKYLHCHNSEDYYDHLTFLVSNLSEYIDLVTRISSLKTKDYYGDTVVFRGIADSEYKLIPGLSRLKDISTYSELQLINEFLAHRPDAFAGLSDFDALAKMQHYGLPTRLLDFSLNPLVALYFACESKMTKDGRVLCHNTYVQNDNSALVNRLCSIISKKERDENYTVEEYLCNDELSLHKYLVEVYLDPSTMVIRPRYWNQRIANQAGVFMVFPNDLYDSYHNALIHVENENISDSIINYGFRSIDEELLRIVFEKEPIDYYRQNNGILTDEYVKKMFNAYRTTNTSWDDYSKFFNGRFKMRFELKPLSAEIVKNSFCSIIIEPKNKKRILQELSNIGFGIDYIYPELEYTAREIKRRFE